MLNHTFLETEEYRFIIDWHFGVVKNFYQVVQVIPKKLIKKLRNVENKSELINVSTVIVDAMEEYVKELSLEVEYLIDLASDTTDKVEAFIKRKINKLEQEAWARKVPEDDIWSIFYANC